MLSLAILSVSAFNMARSARSDAQAMYDARKNFYSADRTAAEYARKLRDVYHAGEGLSVAAADMGAVYVEQDGIGMVTYGVPVDDVQIMSG